MGSIKGDALLKTASVTIASAAFTAWAAMPRDLQMCADQQRGEPLSDRDGFIDGARRTVASICMPFTMRRNSPTVRRCSPTPCSSARRDEAGGGFEMAGCEVFQIAIDAGLIVAFGVARGIEQ